MSNHLPKLLVLDETSFNTQSGVVTFDEFASGTEDPSIDLLNIPGLGTVGVNFFTNFLGQTRTGAGVVTLSDSDPTVPLARDLLAPPVLTTDDSSSATSPVLSGTPTFNGPISVQFDVPVAGVGLTGGSFEAVGATSIEAYTADGEIIGSVTNSETDFEFFGLATDDGSEVISGVSFFITGDEPFGFAIDNLTIGAADAIDFPDQVSIAPLNAVRDEGDAGVTPFTFQLTRSGDTGTLLSVNFDVSGSGADPAEPGDFIGTGVQSVTTQNSTVIPGTGQPLAVGLTLPESSIDDSVRATGFVSSGDIPEPPINIAYVIDVSGSTFSDFSGTTTVGDRNDDGDPDEIADAIIEGFDVLNQQISAIDFGVAVNAALIPFSSTAGIASVQQPAQDVDGNGQSDLIDLLETADQSATLGGVNVGGGTDFPDGLQEAVDFFNAQPVGDNFVFFLSDGQNNSGSFDAQVAELLGPAIDAQIAAFGVGGGADMDEIDFVDDGLDNDSLTDADRVLDPQTLVAQLTRSPITAAEVSRVELFVNGSLARTIPGSQLVETPLGLSYDVTLSGLNVSADDVIESRVVATDGAATNVGTQQTVENLATTDQFPSGSVTFAPNQTVQNVTIGVVGDTTPEGDEGFTVDLSQGNQPVQFTAPSADGLILNDDLTVNPQGPLGILRGSQIDDGILIVRGLTYLGNEGSDFYALTDAITPNEISIIEDDGGEIDLKNGLEIAGSRVSANAVELTLGNGAVVRILNAGNFTFDIGGNPADGVDGQNVGFVEFVEQTLGTTIPASGFNLGGPVTIGAPSGTPVESAGTIQGEPGPNDFVLKVDNTNGALVTNPDFTGQATLDFEPGVDTLVLRNVPGSTVTESDFFIDPNNAGDDLFDAVTEDVFGPSVNLLFGLDPVLGGAGAQVLIPGIAELDANNDQQLDFIEVV